MKVNQLCLQLIVILPSMLFNSPMQLEMSLIYLETWSINLSLSYIGLFKVEERSCVKVELY